MKFERLRWVAAAFAAAMGVGCTPDLGECDLDEARQVVFAEGSGQAAFVGQALTIAHCSSCHGSQAEGPLRRGAPAGLNFDVRPLVAGEDELRLRKEIQRTFDMKHAFAREVDLGDMPPPGERAPSVVYTDAAGTPLPNVLEPLGTKALYNWLACGAPVVAESRAPAAGQTPGASCDASTIVGECRYGREVTTTATWTAIFTDVLSTTCASLPACHASGAAPGGAGIAFADIDQAYDALLGAGTGAMASGSGCGGTGQLLVVPNAPDDSLLMKKITGTQDCGTSMMPYIQPAQTELIRQWIQSGAQKN